jgi:hypothetical protein
VVDHQGQAAPPGQRDQLLGLALARREGLLDEDVLAGFEGAAGEGVVGGDGRGDDDGVEAGVGDEFLVVEGGARRRVAARDLLQTARVAVADPAQVGRLALGEVADQVRPPVAAADDADGDGHKSRRQ